ncbi:hypothetical protein SRHO_G00033000 [Serrasalmus rhombeus]
MNTCVERDHERKHSQARGRETVIKQREHVKKHRKETNAIAKVRCDHLVPRLLEVYKAAVLSGKKILDCLEKDNTNERKQTAALLGLPHYLSEDPADVIRICDAHGETLDVAMKGMQVGLLIGHEGALQDAFPQDIFRPVKESKLFNDWYRMEYCNC